ncbi:MAG: hypothetical protein D6702_07350 [Planctomycetota bacterium]|nr:MAG: hypothetical protein D6702_07350 [Planctomycetota bacterium]
MPARVRQLLLFLAVPALVVACSLVVPDRRPPVPGRAGVFPHAPHLEVGLECADCHPGIPDEDRAGMPDLEVCGQCHDTGLDPDLPLSAQPAGFVLPGDQEATWSSVTATSVATAFSHARHLELGADCDFCHPGVAESEAVDPEWHMSMAECLDCHPGGDEDPAACAGCHPGLDSNTPPASHGSPAWLRAHGGLGGDRLSWSEDPARDCSLCHRESSCDACHASTPPADHSEPWRQRGHGFAAAIDRDRCATCHKENSCVRCHRTATPVTHGGIWGGATSAHCGSCHLPLGSDTGCAVCHRGTPSHRRAPAIPGGTHPGAGADCRSCHVPLDHFDNGQDCVLCHR